MEASERRFLIAANWKMNLLREGAKSYCRELRCGLSTPSQTDVVLFPSFPLLPVVAEELGRGLVAWGGQDLHAQDAGAHTGDVSGPQLVDSGCSWVLCGHSERRRDHSETDELVAQKVRAAVRHALRPVICVGETLKEREASRTFTVLRRQLESACGGGPWEGAALAYEPVWAIGTGRVASAEVAQEAHAYLRECLAAHFGSVGAAQTRIIYGGSVNPGNCRELSAMPDVDGFLVGGASLDSRSFLDIIRNSRG